MSNDQSKRVALKIMVGDQVKEVTFDELTLSNNLGLEALVKVLVDKGVFKPDELQTELENVRKIRYRDPSESQS
ncbi:MAG: hypothetical protein V3W18_06075 [candidate division Zixibacteria bacterium]